MIWLKWADKLAYMGHILLWLNIGLFFILGVLATLLGGQWTQLGEGPGGGWGVPALVFNIVILLGIPSLGVSFRGILIKDSRRLARGIYFFAPMVISFAYIAIAHSIDPCALEIWRLTDRWEEQNLCERFGREINIHTRFHLFLHSAPIVIILLAYQLLFRRIYRWINPTIDIQQTSL